MAGLVFQKASLLCYRLFDIGDEIDLEHARRLVAEGSRLKLGRAGSEYLQLPNPPLAMDLGRRVLTLTTGDLPVEVTARIFDHGAASLVAAVPIPPGTPLEALIPLADELYDSPAVDRLTLEVLEGLRQRLQPAIQGVHLWEQNESYTVLFAERIEGNPTAEQLLEKRGDLARLMLGEVGPLPLSDYQQREVTQHQFSYTTEDLAVVDWNSAFVYEPSGSRDIPDVLEICNAQLVELRYYDYLLDMELGRTYDEVQRKRRNWLSFFRSPYRVLEREVAVTLLELSEFIERVENSLKIIGDFYLAKVYEAAVKRLRVSAWQASVTRKQQILTHVYQLLKGEVDTDRSFTLEFTITLLIVLELFLAIVSVLKH